MIELSTLEYKGYVIKQHPDGVYEVNKKNGRSKDRLWTTYFSQAMEFIASLSVKERFSEGFSCLEDYHYQIRIIYDDIVLKLPVHRKRDGHVKDIYMPNYKFRAWNYRFK